MLKLSILILMITLFTVDTALSLCVSVNQANLRAKPSSKAKLVWTVGKYMPLLAVTQKGGWIQVRDLEKKKMWIHQSLVSEDIDCAVVKVSQSSLRRGPGTKFSKTSLSSAHKYMPFKKLDRDGAWLRLQDDYGFKHWAFEKNLWEPLDYTRVDY